jgi:hypothetical protein
MSLEDTQKEILFQKLKKTWHEPRNCPICHKNDWAIMDKIYEIREFHGGGFVIGGGAILPVICIVCKICGYTIFFNAILLGIVPPEKKEVTDDE